MKHYILKEQLDTSSLSLHLLSISMYEGVDGVSHTTWWMGGERKTGSIESLLPWQLAADLFSRNQEPFIYSGGNKETL